MRGVVSDSRPKAFHKGSDWGKRPCFACGKNTTVKPAGWTPELDQKRCVDPRATWGERPVQQPLCAACVKKGWTPPEGEFCPQNLLDWWTACRYPQQMVFRVHC